MFSLLDAYRRYDPAARSLLEIFICYPGPKAIFFHRIAHKLWKWDIPILPRLVSEFSRWLTGIDIHPGALIGEKVVIDHGMGLVIGETAEVGDNVILYQGVTLGGTDLRPGKRHPTLENGVVVGAGAKILGAIRIGCCSRIGANSVVIEDIPALSTVVGIPGKVIRSGIREGEELCHDRIKENS